MATLYSPSWIFLSRRDARLSAFGSLVLASCILSFIREERIIVDGILSFASIILFFIRKERVETTVDRLSLLLNISAVAISAAMDGVPALTSAT